MAIEDDGEKVIGGPDVDKTGFAVATSVAIAVAVDDINSSSDDQREQGREQQIETTEADNDAQTEPYKSHFRNAEICSCMRWGIPFFLLATFALLLSADIGSGVTAESILMQDGEVVDTNTLLNVSVISSIGKLWDAESYPLAIFIAVTSIGWPYLKLALATYAWMMPYCRPRRRELLIEIIDALGKWSFVDIMVLVEIMVAFRSTVPLGVGLTLEIVIVAQWGFYGFVVATMMSLLSTHVILHYHRKLHYHDKKNSTSITTSDDNIEAGDKMSPDNGNDDDTGEKRGMKELGDLSTGFIVLAVGSLVISMVCFLAGVITKTFEVTSTRGTTIVSTSYSITSIGLAIPEAYIDSNHAGTRFIQIMWFFLGVAMPIWCSVLFVALYTYPNFSKEWMERIFTMAEVAFAWSCAEVLLISTIFAVLQMPVFGDGLVENDCAACFLISTRILPEFSVLCIGTVLNVAVNVWLYRKAHSVIYRQA